MNTKHFSALLKLQAILRDEIAGTETTVRHEAEMPDPSRYAKEAEVHSAVVAVEHWYGGELPDKLPHTARASL